GAESIRGAGDSYAWLADVVLQAHERWMGQGYPNKLKGRQINELAQIIGLVDVFDALVSPRPYRQRLLPHEAIRELLNSERAAFPREIMKALVEQLSVYPLGTKVCLNTGEEGVVIGINPKYPCRPLVAIGGDVRTAKASSSGTGTLDLSAHPLVWITETIAPPDVDRLSPSSMETGLAATDQPVRSSDQFAALLESLDAIANVIQSAVSTRDTPAPAALPSDDQAEREQRKTVEAAIEREAIGLFALEAREWIRQIHVALTTRDQPEEKRRQPGLLRIMVEAMNNLARSAATVSLPAIERMALDLIPLLDAAGRRHRAATAQHLQSLQDGLDRLASAIRDLPCDKNDRVSPEEPAARSRVAVAEDREIATGQAAAPKTESGGPILEALRQLHEARSRSVQPMRDILEEVLRKAEQMDLDASAIDAAGIGRILNDLEALDERFLDQVTHGVPALIDRLIQLEKKPPNAALSSEVLTSILHDIDRLHESAEQVHAAAITLFLQGLRAFLVVAARGTSAGASHRLEAVRARLTALVPLAKQWVDIGRLERTAIIDILPV
ncbi:MAG TPA: HD domain-containing phosphohydrolase, partial [Nitrospiraceae bacterium]|nr:HD domain-containing phosphohydrolase [Nitrospiraceae bacterium]